MFCNQAFKLDPKMNYLDTATQIIKDAIKSAIFIDENALPFYSGASVIPIDEEVLSQDLYRNFKSEGISLAIHKYEVGDENKDALSEYLYEGRDLVLIDWKLTGEYGEELSLKMISDIVKNDHIHFCVVYTKESKEGLERVFKNILSYFSGKDSDYYQDLKEQIEIIEGIDEIKSDLDFISLNRDNKEAGKRIGLLSRKNPAIVQSIIQYSEEPVKKCALIKASIALSDTHKSQNKNSCPTLVSAENQTIVIENTIITLLNKSENRPDVLLNRLSQQIASSEASFTQLLGLEMKTILSKNSSFIDSNMLGISKDAFLYHRNHYRQEGQEHLFSEFVKDVLLENISLQLRNKKLQLLDPDFLNSFGDDFHVKDEELISMNVFYNSHQLGIQKKLNFGDVFVGQEGARYYICITALCDCLRPKEKIDNNFFFAIGTNISKADALKLGDTAFVSFLNSSTIVKWTEFNSRIGNRERGFSPIYIKPVQFKVLNHEFDNAGEIEISLISGDGEITHEKIKYITTIKNSYSQRIANHAFSHPLRVGVDFVKKH